MVSILFRPIGGGVDKSGASTLRGTGKLEVSASALLEPMVIFSPLACLLAHKYRSRTPMRSGMGLVEGWGCRGERTPERSACISPSEGHPRAIGLLSSPDLTNRSKNNSRTCNPACSSVLVLSALEARIDLPSLGHRPLVEPELPHESVWVVCR